MPLKISKSIRLPGRSPNELLDTVDDLKARDVNLISLEERIATTSVSGELAFHIFGAIAHFERNLTSERTKDGLATARNSGRPSLVLTAQRYRVRRKILDPLLKWRITSVPGKFRKFNVRRCLKK